SVLATTTTDAAGHYSVDGLVATVYGVRASAAGHGTVFSGSSDGSFVGLDRPDSGDDATGIDVIAPVEATLVGHVGIGTSALAAEGTTVLVYRKVADGGVELVSSAVVDVDGDYAMGG